MFKRFLFTSVFLAAILPAAPITITYSSVGSGSLGATALSNVAFTITALADTANVQSCTGSCLFVDHDSASITLTGIGTFSFTTGTRTFVNLGLAGFSRAGGGGTDLVYSTSNAAFNSWTLATSIGPITGPGQLLQWAAPAVLTSGGTLIFNDASPVTTFQATVGEAVPEPSTAVATLTGLIAVLVIRRRKQSI